MKLSIIIPVFNEEKTISEVIRKVLDAKIDGVKKEIIVVDDGSVDSSKFKVQSFLRSRISLSETNIKIISHKINQGKGAAVRTGIKNATGDYIIIQDADLEYDPNDISKLVRQINKNNVIYGTRLKRLPNLRRDERSFRFILHYFGNKFLSLVASILYGQWITDMETGYKLFPKKAVDKMNLKAKSFDFEPEITAKLLKGGYKILEVPISTNPRGYNEGKKLNTFRDGIKALSALVKYRFVN